MSEDMNTFTMGPSKIDPDRDLEYFATQATTQAVATEAVRELVSGAAKLLLGTADGLSGASDTVKVRLDDGTYISSALNATGRVINDSVTVVVALINDTQYAVVGLVSTEGGTNVTGNFTYSSTSYTYPCYPVRVKNDPIGLGLGNDVTIYSGAEIIAGNYYGYVRVLNNTTLSESVIVPPVVTSPRPERARWLGVFNNKLYGVFGPPLPDFAGTHAVTNRAFVYDASVGTWTVLYNPSTGGVQGEPIILSGCIVFPYDEGALIVTATGQTVVGGLGTTWNGLSVGTGILWILDGFGTTRTLFSRTISSTGALGAAVNRGPYINSVVQPSDQAVFSRRFTGEPTLCELMTTDPNDNLYILGLSDLGTTRITRVTSTGVRTVYDDVLEGSLGYVNAVPLKITSFATNVVYVTGFHIPSSDQVPFIARVDFSNNTVTEIAAANWALLAAPGAKVVGLTRNRNLIGGRDVFFVGEEDLTGVREFRFGTLP